jgi:hypothetical protein
VRFVLPLGPGAELCTREMIGDRHKETTPSTLRRLLYSRRISCRAVQSTGAMSRYVSAAVSCASCT